MLGKKGLSAKKKKKQYQNHSLTNEALQKISEEKPSGKLRTWHMQKTDERNQGEICQKMYFCFVIQPLGVTQQSRREFLKIIIIII